MQGAKAWRLMCLTATLLLAACSGPAVFDGAPRSAPDRSAIPVKPALGDRIHTVARGETVYAIANRYGLSTRDVIDQNRLLPPYQLAAGQRLVIPGQRIHVVTRGETIYGIARRYSVEMASLAHVNGMGPPYTIYVGQRLRLPGGNVVQVATAPAKIGGRTVTLHQTVPSKLPSVRGQPAIVTTSLPEPSVTSAPPAPRRIASLPPSLDYGTGRPKTKPLAPARSGPMPTPPPSAGSFIWPVEGRVTETFGTKTGGLRNDGLNIAAPRGAPVRAVDNAVVAYAGDSIRGFGKLVLLKHSNGLITAYAHNDTLLVTRGDIVNRGQVIARVGTSGGVPVPQLHFEVRKGTVAVDPKRYLPG